ncbi:MAG: apolipoprotein N-acyltransferase [Novosphingobium sp.]|uniref:apolipoprotein N-acyltransferase n=1 Tax=Novosphingobium sp. TaxID=1874826 RepID=UPI003C7C06CA
MQRTFDLALAWPRLVALILGIIAGLGFEPVGLWPLTLIGLCGLTLLIQRAPGRASAFQHGWVFALGLFALSLNWLPTAFTYQAAMPAWLGWLAELVLSAILALFPALAALAAWHARRSPAALVLALAGSWAISEWLRGWVFTGLPWNPLAAVLVGPFEHVGAARLLPWLGTYALSGLAVVFAGLWFLGLRNYRKHPRWLVLLILPPIVQLWPQSLAGAPRPESGVPYILVQPNIPQTELNDPAHFEQNFARLAGYLPPPAPGQKAVVLWPESGLSDYLRAGYPADYYADTYGADPALARARIARMLGPDRLLLSGAVDLEVRGGHAAGARNVITAIDGSGAIRASYAKAHLVPFGEYVPMRPLLTALGVARFVPGNVEFWPGPGRQTIDLGRYGKAGMLICYEVIFPGEVTDRAHRPDYLFNPSNDGWYGAWGPPQHLAQARMRSLEEGLPMLRSTTTGISAVIDADGRVLQSVPMHAAGVLLGRIPAAHPPTLFARTGNLVSLGWALALLVLSLVALRARPE